MIATGTAQCLAHDPALPHRDTLLDPTAVADLVTKGLALSGRLRVTGCELVRVKYRIGESLRVLYRVTAGGHSHLVTARAFRGGDSAGAYARASTHLLATDGLRPVWHDSRLDTVWWTFPNDRRLRGLDVLMSPPPDLTVLGERWSSSAVAAYAPERSVTLRAENDQGVATAFVKAYAPGTMDVDVLASRYGVVAEAMSRRNLSVRAPRALGRSRERDLLVLEALPGRSWLALDGGPAVFAMRHLGRGIAALHDLPATAATASGLSRFARFQPTRLRHSGELVATARPDVAATARRLASLLVACAPTSPDAAPQEPDVFLHGDCHPGNLLVLPDSIMLIDLDQAGRGPAAADIGSMLARLHHGVLLGERDATATEAMAAAFLDGYSQVRPVPGAASLRWHTAAALLGERALRAVNRVNPVALDRLEPLLDLADEILIGARP